MFVVNLNKINKFNCGISEKNRQDNSMYKIKINIFLECIVLDNRLVFKLLIFI